MTSPADRPSDPGGADWLIEMHDRWQIEQVLHRYVRAVDRADWDLLREVYHPDARDDHGGFKGDVDAFIEYAVKRHRHLEYSAHFLSNIQVDFFGRDVAVVESYCQAFQRFAPGDQTMLAFGDDAPIVAPGSAGALIRATLRYVDRFERRRDVWRIAARTVVSGHIDVDQMAEPMRFGPERVVQRHDRQDHLYVQLEAARLSPNVASGALSARPPVSQPAPTTASPRHGESHEQPSTDA